VLEVGDAGRLDGPDLLRLHLRAPEVAEEASTVAEHHRNDMELEFVQPVQGLAKADIIVLQAFQS
jgi:hypothetical protein